MQRGLLVLGLGLALPLGGGCHRSRGVDVTPIAAADRTLQQTEVDLLGRRGTLQRERKKLADERLEIVQRREQVGRDPAGQAALDDAERKLLAREGQLSAEEDGLDSKLDALLKQRSELVERATQAVAGAPGIDPTERAARREQSVAQREKDLARREAELAGREQALTDRESHEIKRERTACAVVAPAPPLPAGLKYTAHDVEPTYRKALKLMRERGLLVSDLPAGSSRLVEETRQSMKKADYLRAKYDAEQLLGTVQALKIDRGFISSKMARLSAAMQGRKLPAEQRATVEALFQGATANYGDGKFAQANGKINRLFALLH